MPVNARRNTYRTPAVRAPRQSQAVGAARCRRKFLQLFPAGFHDPEYVELEREYKWHAHQRWVRELDQPRYRELLQAGKYPEIAAHAIAIESRTNLLFSFEKMALRDAVRSADGARRFANGLYGWLHGNGNDASRFAGWCETLATLPRRQTRVLTWPVATVFGFLALPSRHVFLKPRVTQAAALAYGYPFDYRSKLNWNTYQSLLGFARQVRRDQADLHPRDMIDLQSFIWIQGSDEYA